MQPAVDRGMTERVRAQMKEKSYLLEAPTAPAEMMAVLSKAKLCLAMRLHTLIFAARMAVPTLGLVYDPKVESFLEELDLPCAGYVEKFDEIEAIRAADGLMDGYDATLAALKEKSENMKRAAVENERLLLKLLEKK